MTRRRERRPLLPRIFPKYVVGYRQVSGTPFTDVTETSYFYTPVLWAAEQGITLGTSETTFSPYQGLARGPGRLCCYARSPACPKPERTASPFTDVTRSDDYYDAVFVGGGAGNYLRDLPRPLFPRTPCAPGPRSSRSSGATTRESLRRQESSRMWRRLLTTARRCCGRWSRALPPARRSPHSRRMLRVPGRRSSRSSSGIWENDLEAVPVWPKGRRTGRVSIKDSLVAFWQPGNLVCDLFPDGLSKR